MPWNASYAFNNANQLPAPIDHRNNELKAGTEWVNPKGMFRFDYWGSFFENNIQTLDLGQPGLCHRLQQRPGAAHGPYDPSGYSNGNGPAFGQSALWPSNTLNSFGVTGMYKALPKTTVNGNVQLTYMRQNERCCRGRSTPRSTTLRSWPPSPGCAPCREPPPRPRSTE